MFALFYLMSIVAVAVVIQWVIENDRRENSEPTTGILRMRAAAVNDKPKDTRSAAMGRTSRAPRNAPSSDKSANAKSALLGRNRERP
jgi:hypothetical protein